MSKGKQRSEKLAEATTRIVDDLDSLIDVLPERVQRALRARGAVADLIEVVLDLGRPPEARFHREQVLLDTEEVTAEDIQWVVERVGTFGDDNRAGIERTLHRISVIPNRLGRPVGLTSRVGRAVFGTIKIIEDLVLSGESILLMGRPGVGKTTMLRETARVLADDAEKRVVIVDTSNEIAGDGDVPHPAIGRARRMQVSSTPLQHHVMIEAVENHMPEVIIIDEMSTELEALAARTIAERGVQLVATAHGNTLDNLVSNPSLSDLVGGTQTVTLGDVEARRRRTQKTVLERKYQPTFNVVVEIHDWNRVGVHRDVARVIDDMLRGFPTEPEIRWLDENGEVQRGRQSPETEVAEHDDRRFPSTLRQAPRGSGAETQDAALRSRPGPKVMESSKRYRLGSSERDRDSVQRLAGELDFRGEWEARIPAKTKVVAFGITRPMIGAEVDRMAAAVEMVKDLEDADMLLTTKAHYARRPSAVRAAEQNGMPVYVLRKGTTEQIRRFLQRFERMPEPAEVAPGYQGNGPSALRSRSRSDDSAVSIPPPRDTAEPGRDSGRSVEQALDEAQQGVRRVLGGERRVELSPRAAFIRRIQHGLASRYNVGSASIGNEPERRVVLRRRRG